MSEARSARRGRYTEPVEDHFEAFVDQHRAHLRDLLLDLAEEQARGSLVSSHTIAMPAVEIVLSVVVNTK